MRTSTSYHSCSSSSSPFHLNPGRASAVGCIGGIFRRFLCGRFQLSGGHAAVRSRSRLEGAEEVELRIGDPTSAPGIVARLMGLESLPDAPTTTTDASTTSIGAFGRSRSTGSLESTWQRPRLATSLSFREVPTYLRRENEDFLLLSFGGDDGDDTADMEIVRIKDRSFFAELEKRSRADVVEEERSSRRSKIEKTANRKEKKKMNNKMEKEKNNGNHKVESKANDFDKKVSSESESSSQNSSPVSVLDCSVDIESYHFTDIKETPCSTSCREQWEPKRFQRNPRRKLSSRLDVAEDPSLDLRVISAPNGSAPKSAKNGRPVRKFSNLWDEICVLTEWDVKRSSWVPREWRKDGAFEELVVKIEMLVVDSLVREVVVELCNSGRSS